ncbi:hypothetical protein KBB96_02605 [Luteolibacter ambystomatis]|uniref:Benzylsuccinate synthase n=1 Tax=Luteolibacter ambystomatis TaxID=2824561 RepID=A0A975PF27_9BACT|nr:hypothetical protein [Luteolibacter ambystomatis]QUE51789.1 hypothetical protein KBB96_02605 [Luteolibacter ambystomatis]
MKTETSGKTATCAACQYWSSDAKGKKGECRRHAPQMLVFNVDDDVKYKSHFPATSASDWCGDFKAK